MNVSSKWSKMWDAALFLLSVLLYANSLWHEFTFDDVSAVRDNSDLRADLVSLPQLFSHDFWGRDMREERSHKSYRPLTVLTFRINYNLDGLRPISYHLVNIVLNGLVVIMYRHLLNHILKTVGQGKLIALIAAAIFAVHPVHTEAVSSIVGRAELLSSLSSLCSIYCYTVWPLSPSKLMLSLVLAAVATLCKEQGVTVLGLAIFSSLLSMKSIKKPQWSKWEWKRISSCVATLALIMVVRLSVMHHVMPKFSRFDNPASTQAFPIRHLTYLYLIAYNAYLLVCPAQLLCDYTMNTVPLVESLFDFRNLATLTVFFVFLGIIAAKLREMNEEKRAVLMAVAMMVLPFVPASNLFFPVGFVVAERVLYSPSMGLALLVAIGLVKLRQSLRRFKWLTTTFVAVLLVSHSLKTVSRDLDWRDELSLFGAGLRVTLRNAKLINNVGHVHERRNDHESALNFFRAAAKVQPDDMGSHINVGRALVQLQRFREAEISFRRAKRLLPNVGKDGLSYSTRLPHTHLNVFLHLAHLVARNSSRLEEADQLYRQAIAMREDFAAAYVNRGEILMRMNKSSEAKVLYENALKKFPRNSDLLYNLAIIVLNEGRVEQALSLLNKTLEVDPMHTSALLNSALVVQEYGLSHLRGLAQNRLMLLVQQQKTSERVYFNLGMLAMDTSDFGSAEKWFKQAIATKPDSRLALFNLALLLAETSRPLESVPLLKQLLHYHDDHIKGLVLLGEIYVNHVGNLDQADDCYKRILEIDPNHVQAVHNRCVVMVERGSRDDLEQAKYCLRKALELAPNETYIEKHLRIVEQKLEE